MVPDTPQCVAQKITFSIRGRAVNYGDHVLLSGEASVQHRFGPVPSSLGQLWALFRPKTMIGIIHFLSLVEGLAVFVLWVLLFFVFFFKECRLKEVIL